MGYENETLTWMRGIHGFIADGSSVIDALTTVPRRTNVAAVLTNATIG